jgi:hypothetical protein
LWLWFFLDGVALPDELAIGGIQGQHGTTEGTAAVDRYRCHDDLSGRHRHI